MVVAPCCWCHQPMPGMDISDSICDDCADRLLAIYYASRLARARQRLAETVAMHNAPQAAVWLAQVGVQIIEYQAVH